MWNDYKTTDDRMGYDIKDTPDPWWVMPLVIGIILIGLVAFGVHASVNYVEEEGYKVTQ